MIERASLMVAIIAIVLGAASIAYTNSLISGLSGQVDQAKKDLIGQVNSQTNQVNSKISPLESSVNSVRQEQTAIRGLVEQRIGGLEKSLQEAQSRLAQAEKAAQQSQQELQALQAEKALEEAAKKEKTPLVYGLTDAPHFLNILWPRFRESYPWAPAESRYIEGFAPLRSRFVSEFQAGAPTADILWQPLAPMLTQLAQYVAPFPDMKFKGLYPAGVAYPNKENPSMFNTHVIPKVIVYNSNLVRDDEAPKSWNDLANPKWKGKIVIEDPRTLGGTGTSLADLLPPMGQEKWDKLMRGLVANEPVLVGSISAAYTKVVAGEFSITIGTINDILSQKPGTPVKAAWPREDPKGLPIGGGSLLGISVKAASPNFSKLLVQWFMSPAGQKAVADTGRPPTLVTVDHPLSLGKIIPADLQLFPTTEEYVKNSQKWQDTMKSLFG